MVACCVICVFTRAFSSASLCVCLGVVLVRVITGAVVHVGPSSGGCALVNADEEGNANLLLGALSLLPRGAFVDCVHLHRDVLAYSGPGLHGGVLRQGDGA